MSEPPAPNSIELPERTRHPGWNAAQVSLLLLAAVALVLHWDGYLLLVATRVVPLNVVALLTAIAALWLHARPRRSSPAWRRGVRLGSVLTLAGSLLSGCGTLVDAPSYTVIPADAGSDCTQVVRESSFLMSGSGTSHRLRGTTGLARETSEWSTDDGARPYRDAARSVLAGQDGTFGHRTTEPLISLPGSC